MTSASEDLEQECRHGITRRFCADCNGVAEKFRREHDIEVERVLALGGWFPARYSGRCAGCGERYGSGNPIHRMENKGINDCGHYEAMCCAPKEEE